MGDEAQMAISVQQWLQLGEAMFEREVSEYRALESRLHETEAELDAKWEGIHQMAQALGKTVPEGSRRLTAVLVAAPSEPAQVARHEPPRGARHVARSLAAKLASPVFIPAFVAGGR